MVDTPFSNKIVLLLSSNIGFEFPHLQRATIITNIRIKILLGFIFIEMQILCIHYLFQNFCDFLTEHRWFYYFKINYCIHTYRDFNILVLTCVGLVKSTGCHLCCQFDHRVCFNCAKIMFLVYFSTFSIFSKSMFF